MINSDLQILTIKDIMSLSNIGKCTAIKLKKEIIKDLKLKHDKVLLIHYKKYFLID